MLSIEPDFTRYLAALHRGERRQAIEVAVDLLQRGLPAEQVVTHLLSRAQAEVGQGWQEGRWSVAMEHRASSITESALQAVVNSAISAPGAVKEGVRGRVVVACSEGEWHMLPGQMATEILRLRGADVSFIGPSVPADELAGFLGDDPPPAAAVACSMPMSLVGAWTSISALRAIGMTVVCAGRGFGADGRWGLSLGADHWAPDFSAGADILLSAVDSTPPARRDPVGTPGRVVAEIRTLRRDHATLVEQAAQAAFVRWPTIRGSDAAVRATREDLSATLRIIAAATLVDDPELVREYVAWFEAVLTGHGLRLAFVPSAFDLFLDVLPAELICARGMAAAGLDACSVLTPIAE